MQSQGTLFEDNPDKIWKTPSDYGGYDPVGHLVLYARTRDSRRSVNHNYKVAFENLLKLSKELELPDNNELVYDWRARHWACGWVEYIMISPEAPEGIKVLGQEILDEINESGVLDPELYQEELWDAAAQYFDDLIASEKKDVVEQVRSEHGLGEDDEEDIYNEVLRHIIEVVLEE